MGEWPGTKSTSGLKTITVLCKTVLKMNAHNSHEKQRVTKSSKNPGFVEYIAQSTPSNPSSCR